MIKGKIVCIVLISLDGFWKVLFGRVPEDNFDVVLQFIATDGRLRYFLAAGFATSWQRAWRHFSLLVPAQSA